jgi:hypothetical protein
MDSQSFSASTYLKGTIYVSFRIIDTRKLEHPRHRPKLLTQLGSVPAEAFPITMKLSAAKKI